MIRFLLQGYLVLLFVDAILSYIPAVRHQPWRKVIQKIADFSLAPIRKVVPHDLPVDISPLIVFVIVQLLMVLW